MLLNYCLNVCKITEKLFVTIFNEFFTYANYALLPFSLYKIIIIFDVKSSIKKLSRVENLHRHGIKIKS